MNLTRVFLPTVWYIFKNLFFLFLKGTGIFLIFWLFAPHVPEETDISKKHWVFLWSPIKVDERWIWWCYILRDRIPPRYHDGEGHWNYCLASRTKEKPRTHNMKKSGEC